MRNKIILTILILSMISLVFSGCGGGNLVTPPSPDSEPLETIIPDTTKVVEEETIQEIASVTEDQSTIVFEKSTPQLEELALGDIIAMGVTEHTPEGLLRKVKNITKGEKDSSEIVVETEFASLEEAIEQGEFYFNEALKAEDAKEPVCYVKGIEFIRDKSTIKDSKMQLLEFNYDINAIIYDYDNNPNTEEDNITLTGQISFDYNLLLSGKITFFQLKELNFQNIVEVEKNLGITVGGSVKLFSYEKILFTQDLGIKLVSIGCCFPVILHPKITISANVDGEVTAKVTAEVTDKDTYTAGIEFNNGGWQPISSHENSFSTPSLSLSTGGSVTFGVGPKLECKVDGVLGPYCKTTLYGKVIADIYTNPWWKIYVGIIAKAGVKIKIFSKVFASADLTILDFKKIIAQADGPFINLNHPPIISNLTANPSSININETTAITCTASDEDVGDTLTYTWTKNGGTFEGDISGSTIIWRSPSAPGNYTVTCEVSDGYESDSKSVNIEVTAIVCNSFIPRYLLDLIDTYANSYYNSAWKLTLDQYKAWIATIAWSEGKKGGFTAHSQHSTDSYPHIYLGGSFKFARGIGPFQLDQHGWDWPTIEKLNPEKALLDVLKTHKNNYGSGSFLQNFSNNSDWRKGVLPGKVETEWFEVTGSAWKDNNNGKNPDLNWSEIKSSLEDSSYENSYEYNVKDIGNRKWNITSNDNLFTSTAKPVIFNGNCPTWLINARKWDGSPLFSYYYAYDQNEGIEVWVYDDYDDGTTYKYIFVREYSTGPYPEGYLNYYCGYTLSHSALTPTPAASLTPEEIELMGKWGFGGDYIVRRWPDGDVNVYDETNYTRMQDVINEWNTAIGGPIVFRLSSDPNSLVKVKFDPDLNQDLAGQYLVYCSDDYEFYRADVNIQKNYLDSLDSDTKYCLYLWLFNGVAGFNVQADVDPNPFKEWWIFDKIPDDIKIMLHGLYKVPCGYNLVEKKSKEIRSQPIIENLQNIYEEGLYKLYK